MQLGLELHTCRFDVQNFIGEESLKKITEQRAFFTRFRLRQMKFLYGSQTHQGLPSATEIR